MSRKDPSDLLFYCETCGKTDMQPMLRYTYGDDCDGALEGIAFVDEPWCKKCLRKMTHGSKLVDESWRE